MPEAQEQAQEEKPQRSLWVRILKKIGKVFLWLLGILAGLLLLAWLVVLIFFPDDKIRRMMVGELEDRLGVEVQAGELDLEIFSGLSLKEVAIGPPPGFESPPVRVERLVVDYSLKEILSKKLTVHRVLVDRPEIHLEVREGHSNLQALLMQRGAEKKEEPQEPEATGEGGFTLALKQVEVRDAHITVSVPGLKADLSGLGMSAAGKFGSPSETHIQVSSHLPVPEEPNLSVDLIKETDDQTRAALGFTIQTSLIGQSRVESSGSFELHQLVMEGLEATHHLRVSYSAYADLDASEAVIEKLQVELDGKSVLLASGGVTGLDENARIRLNAPHIMPPPELIATVLGRVLPEVKYAGAFHLENLSVEGPIKDPLFGASVEVVLDKVSFSGAGVQLRGLSGKFQLGFQPKEGGGDYSLESALSVERCAFALQNLRAQGARLTLYATGSVEMHNGETKLVSPELGAVMKATSLRVGVFDLKRVGFQGRITTGFEPIPVGAVDVRIPSLTASLRVSGDGSSSGSVRVRSGAVKLWLSAQNLNLSGQSWRTEKLSGRLDLLTRKVVAGTAMVDRPRAMVDLSGQGVGSGHRFRRPLRLSARIRSGPARVGPVSVQAVDVRLGTRLRRLAPTSLPLTLNLTADVLVLEGGKISLPSPVKLDLSSVLDASKRVLVVDRLDAGLGDVMALQTSGRFDLSQGRGEVSFGLKPFRIERAVAALPNDLGKGLPPVTGELELTGKVKLSLPDGKFDLEKLEHTSQATLLLRGVGGGLDVGGFVWRDVSGRLKLHAQGPGTQQATASVNLTGGKLQIKPAVDLSGLSVALNAKREGGDFSVDGRVGAARLSTPELLARPLTQAQVEFYAQLVGNKELRLRYLKAALPSLGADLSVGGRFVRIPGAEGLLGLRMSGKLEAGLHSASTVILPGGLKASGEGSLSLSVESGSDGVLGARGRISFDGLNLKGTKFELEGIRGSIPVSQLLQTTPGFGLLAGKPGGEKREASTASARSRAYEEALLPMKGRQKSFRIDRVKYEDLELRQLTGNLELAQGRLNLGSLRLRLLEGDVLAEAAVAFAPPGTRRFNLDAQVSGVDLSGLGALQLAGSSDISGNLRLKLDMGEKVFSAATNLTKIGRSTLQALLLAMDQKESNPGVQRLRDFLNRFKVSPKRVSMNVRHGLLGMEVVFNMGFTARAAARLIQGFEGTTFKLKHLPIGGLMNKYLGF